MDKLKSKTGCLTCLTRRKKCDEVVPKCGHCARLGLSCLRRDHLGNVDAAAISSVNLKGARSLPPRAAITNGYPPFKSDFEQQLSIEGPGALAALVSCMAGPGFRNVFLFGTFSAESRLVRQALVAFSAYHQGPRCRDSYKLSLRSYQNCVLQLSSSRLVGGTSTNAAEQNHGLTAIMFLGLLEALKIGDSSNAVSHFEMCRKLLTVRLMQPGVLQDAALVKLYRVVAECIMFNLAALSPFHTTIHQLVTCWGTSFDCLFPGGDHKYSPFLGGFHDGYRLMLRMNMHLRADQAGADRSSLGSNLTLSSLWSELRILEMNIPASYQRVKGAEATELYRAKHKISVLALRVHLIKISERTTTPSDILISQCLSDTMAILRAQDIREPGNPALRWPLTILACAAEEEDDFQFFVGKMRELEAILDPSNSGKINFAIAFLGQYRQQQQPALRLQTDRGFWCPTTQLDFLLEPQFLERPSSPCGDKSMT